MAFIYPPNINAVKRKLAGVVNVAEFGAAGDGVADDAAAIQAAIDSWGAAGGPVFLPVGTYKILSTINLRTRGSLIGLSGGPGGFSAGDGAVAAGMVRIDATGLGGNVTAITTTASARTVFLANLKIDGPTGTGTSGVGINIADFSTGVTVDNVMVTGFYYGLHINVASNVSIYRSAFIGARHVNLDLYGAGHCSIRDCFCSNANTPGTGSNQANIRVYGFTGAGVVSTDVVIDGVITDEAFGSTASSILVLVADRVQILNHRVYWSGGYGIRLGNGTDDPTNCTIQNVRVEGFASHPVAQAVIELRGSGHTLVNVSYATGGLATPLNDLATGTTMINVNGAYKLPSLPTTAPAAGSKQLWADPADSYRVKLAN